MSSDYPDHPGYDVHALSGAYAVDALDDLEGAAFERHLAECPECRAEVASLREAASTLAETTAVEPPAALRERVLAGIATTRPLPPEAPARVTSASLDSRRPRRRVNLLVAAAAAVLAVGAGAVLWDQPWQDGTSQRLSAVEAVLSADDARRTSLDFDGGARATLVHADSIGRAVLVTEKMPPPPEGKVYQLWLDQPGKGMVSAGLMPVREDQRVLLVGDAATATGAGITVEPQGGSTEPTSVPIALFDFGRKA